MGFWGFGGLGFRVWGLWVLWGLWGLGFRGWMCGLFDLVRGLDWDSHARRAERVEYSFAVLLK